jgi:hypothetical protein
MSRTDAVAVCAVLETSLEDVGPFIQTANILVTDVLGSSSLSIALLKEIETYLAAHFVTLRDRMTKAEGADGVRFDFQGEFGMALDSSQYGQTAQLLDSTGKLASLTDADRIGFIARAGSEATNVSAQT